MNMSEFATVHWLPRGRIRYIGIFFPNYDAYKAFRAVYEQVEAAGHMLWDERHHIDLVWTAASNAWYTRHVNNMTEEINTIDFILMALTAEYVSLSDRHEEAADALLMSREQGLPLDLNEMIAERTFKELAKATSDAHAAVTRRRAWMEEDIRTTIIRQQLRDQLILNDSEDEDETFTPWQVGFNHDAANNVHPFDDM